MTTSVSGADVARLRECPNTLCAANDARICSARNSHFMVECNECGATSPQRSARDEAIAAWNTRTPDQLEAKDASVGWQGETETIERCAKAVCNWCAKEWPVNKWGEHYDPDHGPLYRTVPCDASTIRALIPTPPEDTDKSGESK